MYWRYLKSGQALNLIIDREDLREKIFGVKKGDKDSA